MTTKYFSQRFEFGKFGFNDDIALNPMSMAENKGNHGNRPALAGIESSGPTPVLKCIPIVFGADFCLCFLIKTQPPSCMTTPLKSVTSERPRMPALPEIATRDDTPDLPPAIKNALVPGQNPFAELMLKPKKLDQVLNAISKKRKQNLRRLYDLRSDKKISFDQMSRQGAPRRGSGRRRSA